MPVSTYIIATEPLGPDLAVRVLPSGFAVADVNFVLNYYRLTRDGRMLFGGGVSYSALDGPLVRRRLHRTMVRTLPALRDARVEHFWGGHVAITMDRTPHLGRVAPNVYFAQGYSGHGVLLTGIAARTIAEAIGGQAERFDVFARIPHRPFPGGRSLRMPALVLATTWYRLRDLL
jgi:gamma-glutamylputrescine oxidase